MSETQLAKFQPMQAQDALAVANSFYKSGLFTDVKDANQALVKIMAGSEMGLSPFFAMANLHIIKGKVGISANAMASKLKAGGKYNYRVVKQDETVCSIDFYESGDKVGNSTFTIADAKKAGTQNLDKFPRNMLFARAMSNGVKWFAPDVFETAVYTPEELKIDTTQSTEDVTHEEIPKKLVTDAAVKKAIVRFESGEEDAIEKLTAMCILTREQEEMVQKAISKTIDAVIANSATDDDIPA